PQSTGDTGENQRNPHASHGPGGGISSHESSATLAERVDHQRDGAGEFAGDRQAVAELDPPHAWELERVANRSHSALPSRCAPSCARRSRCRRDVRASGGPLPAGGWPFIVAVPLLTAGAAGFVTPEPRLAIPADRARPARVLPQVVRSAVGSLTELARSPGQGIAILM